MLGRFFAHGSNAVLVALCAACFAFPLHLWLVAVGALLFYLTEYGTHRFMFHASPSRFAWLRAMQHRLHYDHHVEPNRLDLLFLPAWYVVPNLIVVGGVAYAVLGNAGSVASLLLGAMLATLHYEWVHFIAHVPYRPHTAFGRWQKKYHLRHHFQNEHLWFGVSNPLTDMVAGTWKDRETAGRSATTRVLFPND
jgi:4-hydroxysphinganine ceramide fatty acyl 2-hydroxylase